MFFHHNGCVAWLSISKNACTSWVNVFDALGWQKDNLYNPQVDISTLEFFGLLRNPDTRHTMGVVEYLQRNQLLELLDNQQFNSLLASGVFDEHSYAVSHMVPDSIRNRTTFFIIDQAYYDYEKLVKNFLAQHGVTITTPVPRLNSTQAQTHEYRACVQEIKQRNIDAHGHLIKNFLEPDTALYSQQLNQQHKWARPGLDRL